ncbi:MAG: hypothetical protein ACR2O0_14655 [Rhizobiaceae bacterium]
MVDIKNSSGEFTGELPYLAVISDSGTVKIISMGKDEIETGITKRACNDLGIVL